MIAAEVQFYDVVVFAHILAVVLAFGPPFAYPVFYAVGGRADPRSIPALARSMNFWDRVAGGAAGVLILASGFYLVADRWEFGDFFVSWGLISIIAILGVVHGYLIPRTDRLIEVAERDIAAAGDGEVKFSTEYDRIGQGLNRVGTVVGLWIILTIYVMTAKPFL